MHKGVYARDHKRAARGMMQGENSRSDTQGSEAGRPGGLGTHMRQVLLTWHREMAPERL